MAKPKIWCSDILKTLTNVKPIGHGQAKTNEELSQRVALKEAWSYGERIDPSAFPAPTFFVEAYSEAKKRALPDFYRIHNGWCFISERAAGLLEQFDLGQTQIFEVPVFNQDKVTRRPEKHFLLNVAEHKSAFDLEASTNEYLDLSTTYRGEFRRPIFDVKGIAVSADAAADVDIWFDRSVRDVLFFSDRLAKAIKAAKLKRHGLQPCIVLAD